MTDILKVNGSVDIVTIIKGLIEGTVLSKASHCRAFACLLLGLISSTAMPVK